MSKSSRLRTYQDAVVIITGGASGLGFALGEALAQRGAQIVLADLQLNLAQEKAEQIKAKGGRDEAVHLDVSDFFAVNRVIQRTSESYGRIDYLFNNAGIVVAGEVEHYELEDWKRVLDVNVQGVVHGVQAVYPVFRAQGFGHIVNVASVAGLFPLAGLLSYSTSKHAVVGLSTCLRVEAASHGVRVSVLCPGAVDTAIVGGGKYGKVLKPLPEDIQKALWTRGGPIPPQRFARQALKGIAKNKAILVIPWKWKLLWWIYRLSPGLGIWLARRQFLSTQRTVEKMLSKMDSKST